MQNVDDKKNSSTTNDIRRGKSGYVGGCFSMMLKKIHPQNASGQHVSTQSSKILRAGGMGQVTLRKDT